MLDLSLKFSETSYRKIIFNSFSCGLSYSYFLLWRDTLNGNFTEATDVTNNDKRQPFKPRPNEYNILYNIIQLWCCMKCCTRLAALLYRVVSCCMKCDRNQTFSLNKCCTIQHFFCFPGCCMTLYSSGHPTQLCCTLYIFEEMLYEILHSFGHPSDKHD